MCVWTFPNVAKSATSLNRFGRFHQIWRNLTVYEGHLLLFSKELPVMSGSSLQKQAQSIFRAGFSLLQQVSQSQRHDSSDEESDEPADSEDFINNGQRGIIVFRTYSVRSDREKIIHVNLYKGQFIQYYDNRKRTYQCEDIQSITRNSDNNVVIEVKKSMTLQTHCKKIIFDTDQLAHQFHQYIEFINESGRCTRAAFNQVDYRRTGIISCPDLRRALARVDLQVSEQDIINMMAMGTGKDGAFDYVDFVHLFINSFVSNLRQCLQEWLIQATASSSDSSSLAKVDTSLDALAGEVVAFAPTERVHWCVMGGKHAKHPQHIPGVMYATNYRIVLFALRKASNERGSHSRFDVPSFFNMLSIPLTTLQRIYFAPPRNSIYFVCKDHRTVRVTLSGFESSRNKVETFVQVLQGISFYNVHSLDPRTHLFAYKNLTYFSSNELGWNICDVIKEYVRQGLFDSSEWKVLENREYSLSDTYPRYIVLPALMSKDEIRVAAGFRSKARLPVVTYLHRATGAVLTRSAQPMVGLAQKNCPEDEKLLRLYRCKGRKFDANSEDDAFSKLIILDARGKVAATLNMALGKGTEDVSYYPNTELVFCNIDNIHVMRASAAAMADALSASSSYAHSARDRESQLLLEGSTSGYYARIEEAGWLRHVRLILLASVVAAEKLHFDGSSVLVHCSDGWDRTAQMCALTQVLLDPYFRTLEGIATLIEKEWCAFGHKFQDRCGHGQDHTSLPDERSPVFLQFLDCLFQLVSQFPGAFEFTDTLLVFLADHVSSCLYGNFLGNSEKERVEVLDVRMLTKSIWSYVFAQRDRFLNASYIAFEKPLWPNCGAASMRVWERYWLRWDPAAHPNNLGDVHWHDDWGNGTETDPAHVIKRTSYSFVVNNRVSTRRPLGVRGLAPTPPAVDANGSQGGSPLISAVGTPTADWARETEHRNGFTPGREEDAAAAAESSLVPPAVEAAEATLPSLEETTKLPVSDPTRDGSGADADANGGTAADAPMSSPNGGEQRVAMHEVEESSDEGEGGEDGDAHGGVGNGDGAAKEPESAAPERDGYDSGVDREDAYDEDADVDIDDGEDFQVLTDRADRADRSATASPSATPASTPSDVSARHRAARVKNRSIEGDMLPDFREVYDEHVGPTSPVHTAEEAFATAVTGAAEVLAEAEAEAGEPEDSEGYAEYSFPPSGKGVEFI